MLSSQAFTRIVGAVEILGAALGADEGDVVGGGVGEIMSIPQMVLMCESRERSKRPI
jgi:hypothetical protein